MRDPPGKNPRREAPGKAKVPRQVTRGRKRPQRAKGRK
jgi:hypothetical protein